VPKSHLSNQAPGGRIGHHAGYVEPVDLADFLEYAPDEPFDLMLEAKKIDPALPRFREHLAGAAGKA
jgi:hypothetical protein